ncbi:hypothetical protein CLOM_g23973 [Closterium sp. NIES-68]|nr:hypothetical protein CLOM_g23973 [Closterium sp. NIES-68]
MAVAASVCPICLDEPHDEAFLEPCFHSFCFACVVRWLESCTRHAIVPPHLRDQQQQQQQERQQQQPPDVYQADARVAASPDSDRTALIVYADVTAAEAGGDASWHYDVSNERPRRPAVCPVCKTPPLSIVHHVNLAAADFDQLPILPTPASPGGARDAAAGAAATGDAEERRGTDVYGNSVFVPSQEHCKRRRLYTKQPPSSSPPLLPATPEDAPGAALEAAPGAASARVNAGDGSNGWRQQRGQHKGAKGRVAVSEPTESVVRAWMTLELQALMKVQDVSLVVDHLLAVFQHPPAMQPLPTQPLTTQLSAAPPHAPTPTPVPPPPSTSRITASSCLALRPLPATTRITRATGGSPSPSCSAPRSAAHPALTPQPPVIARPQVVVHLSALAEAARPFLFDRAFAFAVRLFSFARPQAAAAAGGLQHVAGAEGESRGTGNLNAIVEREGGAGKRGSASVDLERKVENSLKGDAVEGLGSIKQQAGGGRRGQGVEQDWEERGEHEGGEGQEGRGAGARGSSRWREQSKVGKERWQRVVVEVRSSDDVYGEFEGTEDDDDDGDDGGDDAMN